MINWLTRTWKNKFIRDRIFAAILIGTMFAGFWHAYHAQSDFQKLVGLVPGLLSFFSIFGLVFQDFDASDPNDGGDGTP